MDQFKQIEAFVHAATKGSLSAAGVTIGVTPAMIGRRLDALEARLGVKLLIRTTRRLSLTFEGQAFLEDCQRILNELEHAEASVAVGSVHATGHLRVSAPAGFGRKHVAPLVSGFMTKHPEVRLTLDLTDRVVDLVDEGFDCAVRLGELEDSSLVSVKLAEMRRLVVASPAYLARQGTPLTLEDLQAHECLSLGPQRGWAFRDPEHSGRSMPFKVEGRMQCNDSAVLHEWALAGLGLSWRSLWEVGSDLASGRLVAVLEEFAAPPVGIYAVYPQRRHLPLRIRLFTEHLKAAYASAGYWAY
jgi:DNA-binding transcriptional LysR family regulator